MKIQFWGLAVLLIAAAVRFFRRDHLWVYIPAIIDYFKYPVLPNQPVLWTPGQQSRRIENSTDLDFSKPNIIVILVDDLGFNDISFFGGGYSDGLVKTPNIDSIGRDGISFRNGYAGHATCAPSRAALLTGQFPTRIGYEFTPISDDGAKVLGKYMAYNELPGIFHADKAKGFSWAKMGMSKDAVTLAEALRETGYKTLQVGKWHNGFTNDTHPISRGFNETLGFSLISSYLPYFSPDAVNCALPDVFDKFVWANSPYAIRKNLGPYFAPKGYLTDYLADEAVNAIEANKDDPFFMLLAFTAVHTPLSALKSDYLELSDIPNHCDRVYAAMIKALDRAVGKVLQSLEDNGLSENTLLIFTSDNGGPGYIGQRNINKPFRGWKASFFEGGIHVPFLAKWPAAIKAGQIRNDVISQVDIFPTVLSAAGLTNNFTIDGVNLLPYMLNSEIQSEESIHDILFWRSGHYMAAIIQNYKIQLSQNPKKVWLYDLKDDPFESRNLANDANYKSILDKLIVRIRAENDKQAPPQWPSLSESPNLVDKILGDNYNKGDEYIYWPN